MESQVALGKDSLNELEKSCVEFCCYTLEKIGSQAFHPEAQSSVYFLPCRFIAHFARSRQDAPIHYSSKIRHGEDKVCSRCNTIKVVSLTLTLFTNRVLKHPYYTKTILKLISKCCVCLQDCMGVISAYIQ